MASLQCLDAIKKRPRVQSIRFAEAAAIADLRLPRRIKAEKVNKLYDVEEVEEAGGRVKIHYVGSSLMSGDQRVR